MKLSPIERLIGVWKAALVLLLFVVGYYMFFSVILQGVFR